MLKRLIDLQSLEKDFLKVVDGNIENVFLKDLIIKEADYCVLYYWYRHRAAWNSTKVNHFYQGSIQTSLSEIKSTIEKHRTNGSVFFINIQPTLQLTLENNLQVLLTEINTKEPLHGFKLKYSKGLNNSYNIQKGSRLIELFESLKAQNKLPIKSTAALLFLNCSLTKELGNDPVSYFSLKSHSYGSKYLLGWSQTSDKQNNDSVMKIVKQINLFPTSVKLKNKSME